MPPLSPPDKAETEPIPIVDRRPSLRESFGVLGIYNYRLYAFSQIFANTGVWMARVAIGWLMLELSGDVTLVGITFALQFAPSIVLGAWAGVISDRLPRRLVLMCTQAVGAVSYGTLALLVLTGVVQDWQVLLIAGITGVSIAFGGPSRSAFVSEMVGLQGLRGAISVNAMIFHLGGLVGPAISGALIAVIGSGWSIAANSCAMVLSVVALALMRTRELVPAPRQPRSRGQFREGLAYALHKPTILWPLVLVASVSLFGLNLPVLLAAVAEDGADAASYGLYNSLVAVGALLGAFLSSRLRPLRLRDIVAFTALFGTALVLASWNGWPPLFLLVLVGIGVTRLLFTTGAESMTQLSTNPGIRGRVMSLYLMVLMGGQAAGNVLIGWVAETFGPWWGFLVAGSGPLLAALVAATVLARSRRLRVRVDLRSPRHPVRIVPRQA